MKVTSGAFQKILSAEAVSARSIVFAYVSIRTLICVLSEFVWAETGSAAATASNASAHREA
jgi:hypothetical protein